MLIIRLPSTLMTLIRLVPTFSITIQVSPSCVRPLLNTSGIPSVIFANTSLFQSLSSTFLASLSLSSSLLVQYRGTHLFKFKGASSRFGGILRSSLFVIHVNILHPKPSLFLYGLLLSLRCFSILVNYYFYVSFDIKVIFYVAKVPQNTVTELLS